ncbi:MAG: OadG family protein [Bacteroidales bacterium]|jgi:Na+-transporting methylmalonyl-CoA/oxaloacetate decarboxylase gamma subunit|nr:OadG family protein [Bacteroidales bacterium]
MNKTRIILTLGLIFGFYSISNAQNTSDMRINEVVVHNTNGYEDEYGQRSGWLELFNTSNNIVNIGGCYLSDDRNNLLKYRIPKRNPVVKVQPLQHILFFADSNSQKGVLHLNFKVTCGGHIYLTSSDGKMLVDSLAIPSAMEDDQSYGRLTDGKGSYERETFMRRSSNSEKWFAKYSANGGWGYLPYPTPNAYNTVEKGNSTAKQLAKYDPHGGIMALTAMSVVFMALIVLSIVFYFIGKNSVKRNKKKKMKTEEISTVKPVAGESLPGAIEKETVAAIAMALHMFLKNDGPHDVENTVLTIKTKSSPWSSKIFTLRQTPCFKRK